MIEYEEDHFWGLLMLPFRLEGSVGLRACRFAVPSAILAFLLAMIDDILPADVLVALRDHIGLVDQGQISVLWAASTALLVVLLGFRTNRAMARFWEGTGLLHQMRGEWFDSVSCCVTFSRSAQKDKPERVESFRHTIVRLMSLCHGCALEEISLSPAENLETIDTFGLDDETLQHLKLCKEEYDFNRVEVLLHLIQSLITINHDEGVLKVPPPILSRVYQTLSRGFVNLLNAKKIADTRFPFPYAQTIATLCFVNVIMTPAIMSDLVGSPFWAAIFTFVPIFGFFSLNYIGMELENPFGDDPNDLPLFHFQSEMNNCLMMLLQESADMVPGISPTRCIRNFQDLKLTVGHGEAAVVHQEVEIFEELPSPMDVDDDDSPRPKVTRMLTPSRVSICDSFSLERDGEHKEIGEARSPPLSTEGDDAPAKAEIAVSVLENLLPEPAKAERSSGQAGMLQRCMSETKQESGSTLGTAGDSVAWASERLARSFGELQRLLDDELLRDIERSAGSLKHFCDAVGATIEALPRTQRLSRKSGQDPAGASYLCSGGPRLSSHRPDGLDLPHSVSPGPRLAEATWCNGERPTEQGNESVTMAV